MNSSAQIDRLAVVNPLEQNPLCFMMRQWLNAARPNRDRHFLAWGKWTWVVNKRAQGQHAALS